MATATSENIGRQERNVLAAILGDGDTAQVGVDAQAYRAQHPRQWQILDQLERDQFLLRNPAQDRYKVSLLGIYQLRTNYARHFRSIAELIYAELKKSYRRDHKARVTITDLSEATGLDTNVIGKAIVHMIETTIWTSHNFGNEIAPDSFIVPSEKVVSVGMSKFKDVMAERENQHLANRKKRSISLDMRDFLQYDQNGEPVMHIDATKLSLPKWHGDLPDSLKRIMSEVAVAIDWDLYMLAAMGLRAAIDVALTDKASGDQPFTKKLELLMAANHITADQKLVLENAIELGHATIHRGYIPDAEKVSGLLNIVNHLLQQLYHVKLESERIRKGVPPRKKSH